MFPSILHRFLPSILLVAALLCAGCSSMRDLVDERPTTARLAVTAATLKIVGEDTGKAERVASVARAIRTAAETDIASTVTALEQLAREEIEWSRLDVADTLLVELLITEIRLQLTERLGGNLIPPEERATVATVFSWIEQAAVSHAR